MLSIFTWLARCVHEPWSHLRDDPYCDICYLQPRLRPLQVSASLCLCLLHSHVDVFLTSIFIWHLWAPSLIARTGTTDNLYTTATDKALCFSSVSAPSGLILLSLVKCDSLIIENLL